MQGKKLIFSVLAASLLTLFNCASASITISSTEIWAGGEMHGIGPSGSGTAGDPYVYLIPDGMVVTGGGVIKMNDKHVTFDFSSGTGGLDMAAGGYFDLTGSSRLSDPGACTLILGNNDLTGSGDFKTVDISKDSMDVSITGSGDVTVNSFYVRTNDAFPGSVEIDIGGSLDVTTIDTQDRANGGNDAGNVTIRAGVLTVASIDTRALRTSSSDRQSGNIILEARDHAGTNTLDNTIVLQGTINTDAATGTDGSITISGVVVTLESGFDAISGGGATHIYAGMVQYGKTAAELFIDNSGGGYTAVHNVFWTGAGAELYASHPQPTHNAQDVLPDTMLWWTPGIHARFHELYLGTDFEDVNSAVDPNMLPGRGRQDVNNYTPPGLLEFGTTYYWRIDEVNEPNIWEGPAWNFTTADGKASNPYPSTGNAVPTDTILTWTPGGLSLEHDVYFGTDANAVQDANTTVTSGVYQRRQGPNSFDPGPLELGTMYYWRVDSVGVAGTVKGDVWSLKTALVEIVGHSIVYGAPDKFCGWPANNGVWIWGNEILVGFILAEYVEQPGHNNGSPAYTVLGRSLDGGWTWTMEDPNNFAGDGGTPEPSPGNINFAHPDFALRTIPYTSEGQFFFSYDRGHTWQGPYTCGNLMSHPELSGLENSSRTDYVVNGPDDCLIGMSARSCGPTDRAFMTRTTDGGATFNFVSWINPEPCTTRGVMPSTVRLSENKLVTTLRRKYPGEWIDAFVSYDNGSSWSFLSQVADTYTWNGNPPALVRLTDGRLACAYGNRLDRRIEARISEDEGATWSDEIILRDDYQTDAYNDPDLGYCRMVQRPDGKLVTMYYWATPQHPTHHIAATIWDPGGAPDIAYASNSSPYNGQQEVPPDVVLSWDPGDFAASHDVYFGTNWDDVNDGDTTSPEYKGTQNLDANSYDPCGLLDLDSSYYWRIDESNDANGDFWKGTIWRFTTADYIVVDDMESYDTGANPIYGTWLDGISNWTGAYVTLGTASADPVHGGEQSMVYSYDNQNNWGPGYYSRIERNYAEPQDWTVLGVKALTLYFCGDPNNDANATEQMYVTLSDSNDASAALAYDGDMDDIKVAEWQQWNINLQDFNDASVNLADVNGIRIDFGQAGGGVPGGSGTVYFDDLRLYLPRCFAQYVPAIDLTNDCVIDYADLKVIAADWLLNDQVVPVTAPNSPILHYEFEQTGATTVTDSSGNGYTGTFFNDVDQAPTEIAGRIDPGKYGTSFHFSARVQMAGISMPNDFFLDHGISHEITLACWIKNAHPDELPDSGAYMWEFRQWDGVSATGGARVLAVETTGRNAYFTFHDDNQSTSIAISWSEHAEWRHYTFVRDADNLRLYVDGRLESEAGSSGNTMAVPGLVYLGVSADRAPGNTNGLHDGFTGNIDDWKIFDYALSPAEIVYLATDGTGHYPLISPANIYDAEPPGSKAVNLRDAALLANNWLEQTLWP